MSEMLSTNQTQDSLDVFLTLKIRSTICPVLEIIEIMINCNHILPT